MKKSTLILTLLALVVNVSAQTWAPIGAKWTFGVGFVTGPEVEFREWTCIGDTLVNGQTCKIIKRSGSSVVGDNLDKLITYEDSSKVYYFNSNQFATLYDFNKNSGETWTIMNDTCEIIVTVDSTSTETINGFTLKVQYVSGPFYGKILEHIGHTERPSPFSCDDGAIDFNYYTGLRCYQDSIIGYHSFGIAPSCNYTTTVKEKLENKLGLNIFPNPSTNQITIQTNFNKNCNYSIYNSLGQLVKKGIVQSNTATLFIGELKSGIYNLQLNYNNYSETKRFILEK